MNYAYLGLWGFQSFYSNVRLTFVPWLGRCFLVGEILFNLHILRCSFLIGLSWLGLIEVSKIFPYMLMRVGQARPCQTHQRFYYPLQLPSVGFLPSSTHSNRRLYVFDSSKVTLLALRWGYRPYLVVAQAYETVGEANEFVRACWHPILQPAFNLTWRVKG